MRKELNVCGRDLAEVVSKAPVFAEDNYSVAGVEFSSVYGFVVTLIPVVGDEVAKGWDTLAAELQRVSARF